MEIFNQEIKNILAKTVNDNMTKREKNLDDVQWTHWTAFETLIGVSPYPLVFGIMCNMLVGLEHKALWVLKKLKLELK